MIPALSAKAYSSDSQLSLNLIRAEVSDYQSRNLLSDSILVLDSTGPSLTRHYFVLNAIGAKSLKSFKEIHAYSGGIFAFFAFNAFQSGEMAKPAKVYAEQFDQDFRKIHHAGVLGCLPQLSKLAIGRPPFASKDVIEESLRYCFSSNLLERPLSQVETPFTAHIAESASGEIVPVHVGANTNFPDWTVRDLLSVAFRIPKIYGAHPTLPYFDAALSRSYARKMKSYTAHESTCIVSTPWKKGVKGKAHYVNCFGTSNVKRRMMNDYLRLILNIPNPTWSIDFKTVFAHEPFFER